MVVYEHCFTDRFAAKRREKGSSERDEIKYIGLVLTYH